MTRGAGVHLHHHGQRLAANHVYHCGPADWPDTDGALISGTPAVAGTTNVTLTATNIVGSDVKTLVITIRATYSVYLPLVVR